jgi:hypothetical protein
MLFTTRADVGAHESLAAFTIRGELGVERDCECFGEWSARKVNWGARKFPRRELMQSVAYVSYRNIVVTGRAHRQITDFIRHLMAHLRRVTELPLVFVSTLL